MTFDHARLLDLLPAFLRVRDAEEGGPLDALLAVIAREIAVVEEDLAQLYDDQFVETAAEWVLPYLGDLLGVKPLIPIPSGVVSQRAYVANTVSYRRRRGTAAVLEQLARDITGWDARVVEFFERLATTQYLNHPRPLNAATPNLRKWEPLERVNTAFDCLSHTIDVRRIAAGRGRYNIPNIGVFLWRLHGYPLTDSPAAAIDAHRYTFSPLGVPAQLFTHVEPEKEITHIATRLNVPEPISRRVLDSYLADYYGPDKSLFLRVNGVVANTVQICDLSDLPGGGGAWAHTPPSNIAIDPLLGRIALPDAINPRKDDPVLVTYHYGFSAEMGGGEYERVFPVEETHIQAKVARQPQGNDRVIDVDPRQTIQDALSHNDTGVIEIGDSDRYEEKLSIAAGEGQTLVLRAKNLRRPIIAVPPDTELTISGAAGSTVVLDGLLISGAIRVQGDVRTVRLRHCTLVPGVRLLPHGGPSDPTAPSLTVVNAANIEIDRCILGGLRIGTEAAAAITNSIVDATAPDGIAYAGVDPKRDTDPVQKPSTQQDASDGEDADADAVRAGGPLRIETSTVIGRVHATRLDLASDSIFLGFVEVDRRQAGCVRFCYVSLDSLTPRRYRCLPKSQDCHSPEQDCPPDQHDDSLTVIPRFTSLRYGDPGYCQLSRHCPVAIREGASDGAEMGAFHDLYQPQREANLRAHLVEYLRFGLEAGVFYAT